MVLTTLPAVVAGCWGIGLVSKGVGEDLVDCHTQQCVDGNVGLAITAMAIVPTQVAVLVLVLTHRRRSTEIAAVGAMVFAAVALWSAWRSEGGLAAYFLLLAISCALLALGSAIRRKARERPQVS